MLRSLEIQNFKGIKQGKIDDLSQVNSLVGRNNSGKSTILDALIMLRSTVVAYDHLERSGVEQIVQRRVDQGSRSMGYDELWYGMETGDPIIFQAAFGTDVTLVEQWHSTGNDDRPAINIELGRLDVDSPLYRWESRSDRYHSKDYQKVMRKRPDTD